MLDAILIQFFDSGSSISNNADISKELKSMGVWLDSNPLNVQSKLHLEKALEQVLSNKNIIFITGGNSPASGSLLSKTISEGMGLRLVEDQLISSALLGLPAEYFEYSLIPEGAIPIINNNSAEHGYIIATTSQIIVSLPSDVFEINQMLVNTVFPFILDHFNIALDVRFASLTSQQFLEISRDVKQSPFDKNISFYSFPDYCGVKVYSYDQKEMSRALEYVKRFTMPTTVKKENSPQRSEQTALDNVKKPLRKKIFPSKGDTVSKKFKKIILIVATIAFLGSMGYIAYYFYSSYDNQKEFSSLEDHYGDVGQAPKDYPKEYQEKFSSLYGINSDVKGWLEIEGTLINYPVVQSPDNNYYLRKDFYESYSYHGIPFLDYESNISTSKNQIIYGHNMRDGQMFADIIKYKELDFYKQHPTITFDTVIEDAEYKIVSVFRANVLSEHGDVFNYVNFVNPADNVQTQNFLNEISRRSLINTGVDVNVDDKLLTLSTCTYEFEDARFVIVARKVRVGESTEVDVSQATINPNPLMPDIWYELYGGSKPNTGDMSTPPPVEEQTPPTEEVPTVPPIGEGEVPTVPPAEEEEVPTVPPAGEGEVPTNPPAEEEEVPTDPPAGEGEVPTDPPAGEGEVPTDPPAGEGEVPTDPPAGEGEVPTNPPAGEGEVPTNPPAGEGVVPPTVPPLDEGIQTVPTLRGGTANIPLNLSIKPKPDDSPSGLGIRQGNQKKSPSIHTEKESSNYQNGTNEVKQNDNIKLPPSNDILKVKDATGKVIEGKPDEIVGRIVENELGGQFHVEAIKAQAVATLSYINFHNNNGTIPSVHLKPTVGEITKNAVAEVSGQMAYHNGLPINATYHSASAGQTVPSEDVWGRAYPYLVSVESIGDEECKHFGYINKLDVDYVASRIQRELGINAYNYSSNPEDWFQNPKYENGRYVESIDICGVEKTGRYVREKLLAFKIRSHAFEIESDGDKINFKTYGYGHGVGMSQNGSQYLAEQGWTYDKIVEHYYKGSQVQ